jgi:prepilin peptidase CpaA
MIWSATMWVLVSLILACLSVAIVTDLANRIIPNRLVIVVLLCSMGVRMGAGPVALLASLLSATAVLAALGLLASNDLLGWGDVKLIAALTIAVPVTRVIPLLFAIVMAGGVLSCLYLAMRYALRDAAPTLNSAELESGRRLAIRRLADREGARIRANEPMPYALAVLGGFAYALMTE